MNTPASSTEPGTKPRIEGAREAEILDGVTETLLEVGYDRLTFDAVAARVRAGKATLYRKWPTKAELVVSAVQHLKAQSSGGHDGPSDTGSLAGDLTFHFCDDRDYVDQSMQVFGAVMSAVNRDPELTALFTERFIKPRMAELREVVLRAQTRGEVGPDADVDLLAAILPAAVTYRATITGQCPDEQFITGVIDNVMLPACRHTVGDKGQQPS